MTNRNGLDPRRNAYREDLAAARLEGHVDAPRFATGSERQVRVPSLPIRRLPSHDAPRDTEALLGETVLVYEDRNGWSWVQLSRDGYVGYVPSSELSAELFPATHRVVAVLAIIYSKPDATAEPFGRAPFCAEVAVEDIDGAFAKLRSGGYIGRQHIVEPDHVQPDYVSNALRFVGFPYLLGGRTATGIDCSGLVQNVLQAAGYAAPRDSDMQFNEILPRVEIGADLAGLQRGDIVFWPGHVGIMVDATMLVHATATHMSVTVEPVCDVAERARKDGPVVSGVGRPTVS